MDCEKTLMCVNCDELTWNGCGLGFDMKDHDKRFE
jgi:hypothetical protein